MLRRPKKYRVSTIRAALAAADLFFPGKSAAGRRGRVKKFLRRVRVGSENEVRAKYGSKALIHSDPFLRPFFIASKEQVRNKSTVLHEFAHFFKPVRNDYLAANAVVAYFHVLPRRIPRHGVDFEA